LHFFLSPFFEIARAKAIAFCYAASAFIPLFIQKVCVIIGDAKSDNILFN
jgi:hypothetical protein